MIRYQLGCACGHEFEAWFASGEAFDRQKAHDLLACPACASHSVDKRPMAPAIVKGIVRGGNAGRAAQRAPADAAATAAAPVASSADATVDTPVEAHAKAFVDAIRQMRAHLEAKSENVGKRFAEEARRIHFGESEERLIHGEATADDAKGLEEDGVPFAVLPRLPEEQN